MAAGLASATGAGHLVLSAMDLIPGESTAGPAFAGMGAAYLVTAGALAMRKSWSYPLALLYTVGLVLAYAITRDALPVEPVGLAVKAVEVVLAIVLLALIRFARRRERPASHEGP